MGEVYNDENCHSQQHIDNQLYKAQPNDQSGQQQLQHQPAPQQTQKTVYLRQVTPKAQQGQQQNQPVRLQGVNGNSYEIKGIVHSNQTSQNNGRKLIAVVNKNGSNNYQKLGTKIVASVNNQNGQAPVRQPIYATLNSVRAENGQDNQANQPNGAARPISVVPKQTARPIQLTTTSRTYQGGNVVTQPIRVRLQGPSTGQQQQQQGKTIIQAVQMPRQTQQQQQQQTQQQNQQRNRNSHYAQIKQSAIVGNADNDARRGRVIANRNAQPKKQYQQPQAQAQYDNNHDIKTDYYQQTTPQQAPPAASSSSSTTSPATVSTGKKRQRETREDEGGPGFVKAKGTWYRARKCHKCDKTFPWASSLRRHLMTHTGLKPYCCAACKAQFTTKSNLERHVLRRHGVVDKEGQAKYIIKLSQAELQRQLEEENEEIDPDLNQELFGDHDQRRSNKVSRNATPNVKSPPNRTQTQERRPVQVTHQPHGSSGNTKYIKIEYPQQDKGNIVYDIQDTRPPEDPIEYHEEQVEYQEHPDGQHYETVEGQEHYEEQYDEHGNPIYPKTEQYEEHYEQQYDEHGNPIQYEHIDANQQYDDGTYDEQIHGQEIVEGQEYEQGHYEEHYDDSQQAEYQEYQEEHITDQHHHQDRHSPQQHRQHHHQVHKDHYQQDYQTHDQQTDQTYDQNYEEHYQEQGHEQHHEQSITKIEQSDDYQN